LFFAVPSLEPLTGGDMTKTGGAVLDKRQD